MLDRLRYIYNAFTVVNSFWLSNAFLFGEGYMKDVLSCMMRINRVFIFE